MDALEKRIVNAQSGKPGVSGHLAEDDHLASLGPREAERPSPIMLASQCPKPGEVGSLAVNPDFAFVRSDYRVRLASAESHLYTRACKLVTSMYGSRGLITSGSGLPETQPELVTLAVSSGHRVFGTLTLGVDSGTGLLADSLYQQEINELRARGGRLCEVTRLALDPELSCPEVMATIFNVTFLLARVVHARTDLIAEVHPRHAPFYQRNLGYQVAGPVRTCQRVSAPAVLMRLCLDFARNQIRRLAGNCVQKGRSLYKLFLSPAEEEILLQQLTRPSR